MNAPPKPKSAHVGAVVVASGVGDGEEADPHPAIRDAATAATPTYRRGPVADITCRVLNAAVPQVGGSSRTDDSPAPVAGPRAGACLVGLRWWFFRVGRFRHVAPHEVRGLPLRLLAIRRDENLSRAVRRNHVDAEPKADE
jgi:hypothetical protein